MNTVSETDLSKAQETNEHILSIKILQILFTSMPIPLATNLVAGILYISLLWQAQSHQILLLWFAGLVGIIALRSFLVISFKKRNLDDIDYTIWSRLFVIGTFLTGFTWGLIPLLSPYQNIELYHFIVLLFVCGLSAGAVVPLSIHIKSYLAFITPMVIPVIYHLSTSTAPIDSILTLCLSTYLILLILSVIKLNKIAVGNLRLQFEKEAMTNELREQKKHIEGINTELENQVKIRTNELSRKNKSLVEEIKKRKHAEEIFLLNHEKFSKAFRASPDPITISRVEDGLFIEVNDSFLSATDFARDEVIGHTAFELGLWTDTSQRENLIKALADDGSVKNMEVLFTTKNGETVQFLISAELIRIDNEECVLMASRDITEERRIRNELIQSEEKFSKAFWSFPDPITISRIDDGTMIEVNDSCVEVSGYSREEILGKNIHELGAWADPKQRDIVMQHLKKDGYIRNFEADFVRKDGSLSHCIISATIIIINKAPHMLLVTRDISVQKKAQDDLVESEARYRQLVETMRDGLGITDEKGIITYVNSRVCEMLQLEEDKIIGCPVTELVDPNDLGIMMDRLKQRSEGLHEPYEITWRGKDGLRLATIVTPGPIYDEDDNFCGSIAVLTDISQRKQAELALKKSEERFDLAVQGTDEGIWDWDIKTNQQWWSPRFYELLGYKPGEITNDYSSFLELLHPEDKDAVTDAVELHLKQKLPYDIEFRMNTRSGNHRWFRSRGQAVWDEADQPVRMCGSICDCTTEKEALLNLQDSEQRFKNAFSSAPTGLALVDKNGRIFHTNPKSYDIVGYNPEELTGISIKDLTHPDDIQKTMDLFQKLIRNDLENYTLEKRYKHKNGNYVWCKTSVSSIKNTSGEFLYAIVHVENISERKRNEQEINKLLLSIEHSPNIVIITDKDARIEYINPKFTEVTGYSAEEVIGNKPDILAADRNEHSIYDDLWATIKEGNEWRGELLNRKKNGELYWASQIIFPIKDESDKITHYVSLHEDVTEARKITEQLSYQASHDSLTGLINRSEFEQRLQRAIESAAHSDSKHVLCLLDLDQFKLINDAGGHMAGDEFLRQFGVLIKENVRQRDTVARLGGDEFAILIEHCPLQQATKVAEQIRTAIQAYNFVWEDRNFTVSVSIGLTSINNDTYDLTEVLRQADMACYTAKDTGRNRIHIYHEKDLEVAARKGQMDWAQKISEALAEDQFLLYAQPIVPVSSHNIRSTSYEILLRLENPGGTPISPGTFLPAAERYNLSVKIDSWVINNTINWISNNINHLNKNYKFAINLSGASLNNSEIKEQIIQSIINNNIPSSMIRFEVTETAAIRNLREAIKFMSQLNEYGCSFSLDDFGSGVSSFAYLKNLPIDTLKIDGMFVKELDVNKHDYAMVRIINEIGKTLGLQTIAEYVENESILEKIKEIGVDYAQGYLISKAVPIDSLLQTDDNKKAEIEV